MSTESAMTVGQYQLPEDLHFDEATHLWVRTITPTRVRCGFDPLGSETCGDIVALSFEPVGGKVRKGEGFGSLEAAKFVGPLLAPISGTIVGHNQAVLAAPGLLNSAPLEHWLIELDVLHLETELAALLHGRDRVLPWFEREIERFKQQGMVAE